MQDFIFFRFGLLLAGLCSSWELTAQVGMIFSYQVLQSSFPKKRTAKPGIKMSEFVARFRTKPKTRFRTRFYS